MNTENVHSYYEILGLAENATQQEVHAAYTKAKAIYSAENKTLHSVFNPNEANELRVLIEEAYRTLSEKTNPVGRATNSLYEKRVQAERFDFKEFALKKEWTGQDLKKVREYRKLSFDELTDITKINPWYIAALEDMDPANLPVEVFVRGYIIHISRALGLNEKVVADSYMRLFRKKIENQA